jgi:outer membrane lipoprotein-sorting protein
LKLACFLLFATGLTLAGATTDAVLARMDQAAATFRGVSAKIKKTSYTAIIKESSDETGTIRLLAPKPRSVNALVRIEQPDPKLIAFRDKKAQIYLPKINTVQEYDLGKYDSLLTQGLLIGFATPVKELKKTYSVEGSVEDPIDGKKTTKLTLVPTQEAVKQHLSRIELWINDADGLPVRQKLHQLSGDYTQIDYSDMKLEPGLADKDVRLELPANVKREYPQK